MEYVLNHALDTSDTSRQPDRRMRPQSAFVPRQSYFKQKGEEDDVGRSVLQHKPLAKGEHMQLSLAKVFEDEPGMRPKVFAPSTVNKISYALMSHDISGASPHGRAAPNKPRDTDPNTPRYILPGTAAFVASEAAAAAAAAAAAGAVAPIAAASTAVDTATDASNPAAHQQQQQQQPTPHLQQPTSQQVQQQPTSQQVQHQEPETSQRRASRDTLNVSDINAVESTSERPNKIATRNTQFSTRDVEGSWPGWEPPFRAHVGKSLRDPGLDVSDISGTQRRRRIFSARPNVGSNRRGGGGGGGAGGGLSVQEQSATVQPSPPPQAGPTAAASPPPPPSSARNQSSDQRTPPQQQLQQQQAQSYLPPPLSWQPVQYDTGGQLWSSSEGSSSGGSGSSARRYSHSARQHQKQQQQEPQPGQPGQQEQQQPQAQQAPHEAAYIHAAGAWPTTVTMPLRPTLSPPPFATHIPTGSIAAVLSTSLDPPIACSTAAVADHPSTTVGKPSPGRRDAHARHVAKLKVAEVQRADTAEAQRIISSLQPTLEAVEEFFSSCRRLDRESCGKLAPTDFMYAMERANLMAALEPSGGSADAAAALLARGLQDGAGMVSYRYLSRALLGQTLTRRSSSTTVTTPTAATAVPMTQRGATMPSSPPAAESVQSAAVAAPAAGPPAAAAAAVAAAAAAAVTADIVTRTPSASANSATGAPVQGRGQDTNRPVAEAPAGNGSSATRPSSSDRLGGGSADGSGGPSADATALAAARPATPRRGVIWAPEPPLQPADGGTDGSEGAVTAPPPQPPTLNLQEQQRLERQERQLRREGSMSRRRPYSAAPGGPKGASAVAAVFKLLGAPQPILYDTPPPAPVHVPAASPAASTCGVPPVLPPPPAPAAPMTSAATAAPPPTPYDGMGFGPRWPPEPRQCNLQKRSTTTIMDASNVQLRDVCDTTYFPFKNHALWFSGRVGPEGLAAPGGPAEAAREYQPSVDITSFIVGKGHHRLHVPGNGHKLEPEVEAALVAKLRPRSAVGETPEATARVKAASSVVKQLNEDSPLQYPGHVDPSTPAGAALRNMLGPLYSASAATATAAAGAVRPSTAGPRRSTHSRSASVSRSLSVAASGSAAGAGAAAGGGAAAAGAIRVGRVALERQMHRDEVAAVRRLC